MGAEFSQDNRSDVKSENIRLKELNPAALAKIKNMFEKNPLNTQPDKKQLMSMLSIGKRETDIIFEYFDMDGNGLIDSYEFICAIAMLVHSSVDVSENSLELI
jgi:hypothetical protein